MKKTYISPVVEEIRINTMQIIASSPMPISSETVTDESEVLSRELDFFFD